MTEGVFTNGQGRRKVPKRPINFRMSEDRIAILDRLAADQLQGNRTAAVEFLIDLGHQWLQEREIVGVTAETEWVIRVSQSNEATA